VTDCIVDTSVAVKWFLTEVHSDEAALLLDRQRHSGFTFHAPDLLNVEAGSVFTKYHRRAIITYSDAVLLTKAFLAVPKTLYPSAPFIQEAVELACKFGVGIYDSVYLILAKFLGHPLVTADLKFYRAMKLTAAGKHLCWVGDLPDLLNPR
jgi:predicted nucleic acid-binding protein